jgi:hypothetical protein
LGSSPGDAPGRCRFAQWTNSNTLDLEAPVPEADGCIIDFFGNRVLWAQTERGHLHPPAPYDRFEMIVRVPADITSVRDGAYWEGWALCTSTD